MASRSSQVIKVKRSDVQPGDIILGPVQRDLPLIRRPPRPQYLRRVSSLDRPDFDDPYRGIPDLYPYPDDHYRGRGTIARRRYTQEPQDPYDSEGSIPPRSRRPAPPREKARFNPDGTPRAHYDGSSDSSSDLGSTTDDEKHRKKAKWKKWGAIGLAGVATIHAVHGVKETVEKTKARREELASGEISPEEARKKKTKQNWRNAADVGIAGIWVKSAYDEIKEYKEAQEDQKRIMEKCKDRHKKRVERARAIQHGEYEGHHVLGSKERRKYLGGSDSYN